MKRIYVLGICIRNTDDPLAVLILVLKTLSSNLKSLSSNLKSLI